MSPYNPTPTFDCYTRPDRDVYGTQFWDECRDCGGVIFGPIRYAYTAEQIAETGARRKNEVPEPCSCVARAENKEEERATA